MDIKIQQNKRICNQFLTNKFTSPLDHELNHRRHSMVLGIGRNLKILRRISQFLFRSLLTFWEHYRLRAQDIKSFIGINHSSIIKNHEDILGSQMRGNQIAFIHGGSRSIFKILIKRNFKYSLDNFSLPNKHFRSIAQDIIHENRSTMED